MIFDEGLKLLEVAVEPDFQSFRQCVLRQREPRRVHYAELLLDEDVIVAVAKRFGLPSADVGATNLVDRCNATWRFTDS